MATTLTKLPFTRWTITGTSGPQPLAGTEDRAAEAYAAMCAAEWVRSDGDATVPAHDYDAASPAPGDAYRQTWGYDADARTERSATGAVCSSVKIPADALTGTACSVSSVAASLFGDRWLDGGAIVSAILSADATPPPFSDFISASVTTAAMLAPTPATKPAGAPANWRNLRDDSSETLALTVGESAAAYLHICLRVYNYHFTYGAWHDGGAMLDPSTLAVTFSRDVTPDAASARPGCPLDVGLLDANGAVSAADAVGRLPLASVWINWSLVADPEAFAGLAASTDEAKVRNLLSYIYNSPGLYDGKEKIVLSDSAANLGKSGVASVMTAGVYGFCALVSHGVTAGRTYTGLTLENPINPSGTTAMPYRLLVYAISPMNSFGSSPAVATPVPWWGDVVSRQFREGRSGGVRCLAAPADANGSKLNDVVQSSGSCATLSVTPLARLDVTGTLSEIPFDAPYRAAEMATILMALVPNATPSMSAESETLDVTVTRKVSGLLANDGVSAATSNVVYVTQSDGISTSFSSCHAHHILSWPHVPGVTTKNGIYVWKSHRDVTWTDYPAFEIYLTGTVTIASGDNAGTYRWATAHNGAPGDVYYNWGGATPSVAVVWKWFYLGTFGSYDLARIYGHVDELPNIPVRLVKLDENGDATSVVLDGCSVSLANLHLWIGGEFVDTSKYPSGHTVAAGEFAPGASLPSEAWGDDESPYVMKYPGGAVTYSFTNATINADTQAHVEVSGTASVTTAGGETYTAELPAQAEDIPYTVRYKTGSAATAGDGTGDMTYFAHGRYTLQARQYALLFRGPGGDVLPLVVSLPAKTVTMPQDEHPWIQAKSICLRSSQIWNDLTDAITDGATQNGKGLTQTIDVGLVTLHE